MCKLFNFFNFKKETDFDYLEFERQRADNPMIKQLEIDRAKYQRTIREIDHVGQLSIGCGKIVLKYCKKIPQEDFSYFMLYDGHTAFLPLSIKPFLQPWDQILLGLSQATITSMKPSI